MSYWVKDYTKFNDVTINGVTYTGVVGHCLADTVSDLPPRIQGTRALLIGSDCEIVSTGDKYEMDTYGNWHIQPKAFSLDLTGYYTSAETDSAISTGVTTAINALDVSSVSIGADETLATLKETNGKISSTKQSIQITESQVTGLSTDLSDLTTLANGKFALKFSEFTAIPDNANLGYSDTSTTPITIVDGYTTPGIYVRGSTAASIVGRPSDYQGAFLLIVQNTSAATRFQQILFPVANISGNSSNFFYKRYYTANGWQEWCKFEGTGVQPVIPTP